MATAAKFPSAAVTLADLGGEASGFPEAILSGAHSNSVATITLTATVPSYWPTSGWVTIDSEIISYAGKAGATLTGCVRGVQSAYSGSAAASHADQAKVAPYLTPQAVSQIMAELVAVETQFFGLRAATQQWDWYWVPGMPVETTFVGTGTYAAAAVDSSGILATGATSASSAGLRKGINLVTGAVAGVNGTFEVRYWSFTFLPFQIDANVDCRIFVTDESVTTQPSLTAKHMGIRQTTSSTFLFSTADGTTEQTTDVTASIANQTEAHIVIVFDGTTARCYIDGTLRATHATNVPTSTASTGAIYRAFILNSAAADKKLYVGPQRMQGVA